MTTFEMHSLPIDLGTPYLTNESAYFLGGIIAADENITINGIRYWISPVRYNKEYVTKSELQSHYRSVNSIANVLNNQSFLVKGKFFNDTIEVPKFNNRHHGFVTLFPETKEVTVEELATITKKVLKKSSEEVVRCFIAGIFDGRGAIDFNTADKSIRFISLDCENISVVKIFRSILSDFVTNYNTSRERLEGGNPRDNQFRIKNIKYYYRTIGFVSDVKIKKYLEGNEGVSINQEDTVLIGLKTIS